ncbi:MAG: 30S ribosomal protein S7 [Fibrobacteria bacterium]|nr:30S ribosomal protein S7 [Fibrobacteria bacterium]
MSRRNRADKRRMLPDVKFGSVKVAELINVVLQKGKYSIAERIVYNAIDHLKQKIGGEDSALDVFNTSLDHVKPNVEVKSRRIGGANYQVPIEVPDRRSTALALRWIVDFSKKRNEKDMAKKLGSELVQAYNNEGSSIRKKVEVHKMAEANKAFAHFKY